MDYPGSGCGWSRHGDKSPPSFAPMADVDRLDAQSLRDPPEPPDPDAERRQRFARLRAILGESPHDSASDTSAA